MSCSFDYVDIADIAFILIPTKKSSNGNYKISELLKYIIISPQKVPKYDNTLHNVIKKMDKSVLTYYDRENKCVYCKGLKGPSVNELATMFSVITKTIKSSNQLLKTELTRLIFDIKRSGDTFQSQYCNIISQLSFDTMKFYVITHDYLACAIALESNSRVIFTNNGLFYAFHKISSWNSIASPSKHISQLVSQLNIDNINKVNLTESPFNFLQENSLVSLENALHNKTTITQKVSNYLWRT